jgi:hypothetical protein
MHQITLICQLSKLRHVKYLSHTQNLIFSDSPLIRILPSDDVGQERRQYFWPEAVGNENLTRKRSNVMTFGRQNQFTPTPSKQGRIGDMKDISVEVDNECVNLAVKTIMIYNR